MPKGYDMYRCRSRGGFNLKKHKCLWCGKRVEGFRDYLSLKEYSISGLCQECQDRTFGDAETTTYKNNDKKSKRR